MKPKTTIQRIFGTIRIHFGFCPECNSSAPELYKCQVCNGYHSASGDPFPPSAETKEDWRRRFLMARCQHGRPMEDTDCPECRAMFRGFADRHRNAQDPRRG